MELTGEEIVIWLEILEIDKKLDTIFSVVATARVGTSLQGVMYA